MKVLLINGSPKREGNTYLALSEAAKAPGEVTMDEEGMQTMRTLGRNMAWVLNSIKGRPKPQQEQHLWTNFIR